MLKLPAVVALTCQLLSIIALSDACPAQGGVAWEPAHPGNPPERFGHAMASDSVRQRVVLFGGWDGMNSLSDTWEWDGVSWTQATFAQNPIARWSHAMAYDAARQRVVRFGGPIDDTWLYSSSPPPPLSPSEPAAPAAWASHRMATGLSNTFWVGALIRLPTSLVSWGMPGCTVYTDVLDSELLVNTSGLATWTRTIPNNANLIGMTFYNQGFIIDPGVNAMGATVSNAGEGTIGMR